MNYFTKPTIDEIIEEIRTRGSATVRYTVAYHWSGIEVFISKRWYKESDWHMYVSYGSGGVERGSDENEAVRAKAYAMIDAVELIAELKTNYMQAIDSAYAEYEEASNAAAEEDRRRREEKARLEAIAKAQKEAVDAPFVFGSEGAKELAEKLYAEIKKGSWGKNVYYRPAGSAEEFEKYVDSYFNYPRASVERTSTGRASFFLGSRRVKKEDWIVGMSKAVPIFMEI